MAKNKPAKKENSTTRRSPLTPTKANDAGITDEELGYATGGHAGGGGGGAGKVSKRTGGVLNDPRSNT